MTPMETLARIWLRVFTHAAWHWWNPVGLIMRSGWAIPLYRRFGFEYPGWSALGAALTIGEGE